MAAHDENISQNRRRLFKALSTAPVVATLSPGEVLARESSFQCATKEMPEATVKFHKEDPGCSTIAPDGSGSGAGCHAYEHRFFFDPEISGVGSTDNCAFWNDKFVVETSPGVYYVVMDPPGISGGEITPSSVPAPNSIEVIPGGGGIVFWGANGGETGAIPCAVADIRRGLFLAIGEPELNADGHAIGWKSNGVWPELEPNSSQGALAGSCLTSFPNSAGFFLADS